MRGLLFFERLLSVSWSGSSACVNRIAIVSPDEPVASFLTEVTLAYKGIDTRDE